MQIIKIKFFSLERFSVWISEAECYSLSEKDYILDNPPLIIEREGSEGKVSNSRNSSMLLLIVQEKLQTCLG